MKVSEKNFAQTQNYSNKSELAVMKRISLLIRPVSKI